MARCLRVPANFTPGLTVLNGLTGHPEGIVQGGVAVSSGEMSEGSCQLYSWTHRISHQGPVPLELSSGSLLQFLIELRWMKFLYAIRSSKWSLGISLLY